MKISLVLSSFLILMGATSCQESKLETSTPSSTSASSDAERKNQPQTVAPADSNEKVDPPVPIAGVWLNANVLEETNQNGRGAATIGISSFYNGVKVSDQRDRFMVTMTASSVANNGVQITQEQISTGNYDQRVTVEGQSLGQVRNAYSTIMLYVTIYDRNDNTTDTWSSPLDSVLSGRAMRTTSSSSSSSQSTSTATAGTAGAPGAAGKPGSP